MKCLPPLLLALVSLSSSAMSDPKQVDPQSVGLDPARLQLVTRYLEDQVEQGTIAGAMTLVARHGRVVYRSPVGYRDLESKAPMEEDTIFRTMSITKVMTSLAVLQLQEDGLINIQDPISKYIPAFGEQKVINNLFGGLESHPAEKQMTIRHVLTHRSGTPYRFWPDTELVQLYVSEDAGHWNLFHLNETIGDYIERIAPLPRATEPGQTFQYGWGPDILGYLIEIVSGQTLAEYFHQNLFYPLGMEDSHFFLPEEKMERFTSAYVSTPEGGLSLWEPYHNSPFINGPRKLYSGAAGVVATADDLFRLCQAILQNGQFRGQRIISRKSIEAMTENQISDGYIMPGFRFWGDKFGLGFGIRTERGEHDGLESLGTLVFSGVYSQRITIDPREDLVIVFMVERLPYDGDYVTIPNKVTNMVYASIDDTLKPFNFKK